mgnify:CR=1 FL=1
MKRFITTLFAITVASTFTMSAHAQKLNQVLNEDEASLKAYFDKEKLNAIEGVYKNFNGSYYRLGIKKMGDVYCAIILDSYDKTKWKPGTVKAIFESTAVEGVFAMRWLMGDRSTKETVAQLENDAILKFKMATGEFGEVVQTQFIKLYPKAN